LIIHISLEILGLGTSHQRLSTGKNNEIDLPIAALVHFSPEWFSNCNMQSSLILQ